MREDHHGQSSGLDRTSSMMSGARDIPKPMHPNLVPYIDPVADGGPTPPSAPASWIECQRMAKITRIQEACDVEDFEALAALAGSEHGLVSDVLRQRAWPILLGCKQIDDQIEKTTSWRELPEHEDEHQVKLDVDRSFIHYPQDQSAKELDHRKEELSDLITEILRRHPYLCYFQGYHDICQVLLLVLGPTACVDAVSRLSILRIRDFMLPSLAPALAHLRLIPSILHAVDPILCKHLSSTQPFFALAATLTLYAHDIQEYGDIARLFDVLLAREASYSIYLFAQIVILRKTELMDIPPDEPEMLHSVLCKLPQPLNLEELITNTSALIELHPPESLRPWRKLSSYSVLKTARSSKLASRQRVDDGAQFFEAQSLQLQRAELRQKLFRQIWYYRRPAKSVGLAVLIGVMGWWLRRSPLAGWAFGSNGIIQPIFAKLQILWPSLAFRS